MTRRLASLVLLLSAASGAALAQVPYTTIQDTLPPGTNGLAVNGSITVIWTEFTYESYTIAQSPLNGGNYPIQNGAVNIPLVPTDHASTTVTYKVVTTVGGNSVTTYWRVPTLPSAQCASSSHCTIQEVTVAMPTGAAPLSINPTQIQIGTSVNGQAICNVAGIVGWCTVDAPSVWGNITGTLADQTDLAAALATKPTAVLVTTVGSPGLDTNVASEKAIRSALSAVAATWGSITGTLSNQSDLAAALAAKPTAALVTTLGSPGLDTNVASEKAIRTAIAAVAGGGNLQVYLNGISQGTEPGLNFNSGTGMVQSCVDNPSASRMDCTPSYNSALIPTHDTIHANESYCVSSNGSTGYTCTMPNKALTAYTAGQTFLLNVDTTCASTCTLNIDGVGIKTVTQNDGMSAPGGKLVAGQAQWIWYDGTVMRLMY